MLVGRLVMKEVPQLTNCFDLGGCPLVCGGVVDKGECLRYEAGFPECIKSVEISAKAEGCVTCDRVIIATYHLNFILIHLGFSSAT